MLPDDRLLVMVAPNGARRSKADHPHLPITPDELAEAAAQAVAAGAAAIHLHVRDEEGRHSLDPERYRMAVSAIRARVGRDPVIQISTESVGLYEPEEQMELVRSLWPEAVSLAIRELVPDDTPAAERRARVFFWELAEAGVWTQFILYDRQDILRFHALRERGVIAADRPFVLLVLGRGATLADLPAMLHALSGPHARKAVDWMVCGFDRLELPAAATAIALGGHVRVGFENNLRLADGRQAPDNAALVRQLEPLWRALGRRPLAPSALRQCLKAAQLASLPRRPAEAEKSSASLEMRKAGG